MDYLCAFFKKLHIKNIESGVNQMDKKNILTYEGLKKLEDELQNLKVVKRKEVAQKIKEAREQGDLSETQNTMQQRTSRETSRRVSRRSKRS